MKTPTGDYLSFLQSDQTIYQNMFLGLKLKLKIQNPPQLIFCGHQKSLSGPKIDHPKNELKFEMFKTLLGWD